MVNKDNPAGRLYTILRDAERQNEQEQALKAWAHVFDIAENNELEIIRSVLSLQELVEEVHSLVETNPQLNAELFLKSFPEIRRAVSAQTLTNPWKSYKVGITPEAMTRLEFCSEILGSTNSEEIVSDDEIAELKNYILELNEYVEKLSIEHELKVFLFVQLENIRRGIFDYKIHGASGIRKGVESLIGSTISQTDKYQQVKNQDEDVLNRLGELLNNLDKIMSKALKVKKVLGNASKLLGLPWLSDNNET